MVAVAGEEVGKGAEFLIQVLTQGVEFGLDSSSGGFLMYCLVPRVPGRSKIWVATGSHFLRKLSLQGTSMHITLGGTSMSERLNEQNQSSTGPTPTTFN